MNRRHFFGSLLGLCAVPFIPVEKPDLGAQKMYNYWVSQEQEMIALAPKKPWIAERITIGQKQYYVERSPVRGGGKTFILHDVKDTAWMRS